MKKTMKTLNLFIFFIIFTQGICQNKYTIYITLDPNSSKDCCCTNLSRDDFINRDITLKRNCSGDVVEVINNLTSAASGILTGNNSADLVFRVNSGEYKRELNLFGERLLEAPFRVDSIQFMNSGKSVLTCCRQNTVEEMFYLNNWPFKTKISNLIITQCNYPIGPTILISYSAEVIIEKLEFISNEKTPILIYNTNVTIRDSNFYNNTKLINFLNSKKEGVITSSVGISAIITDYNIKLEILNSKFINNSYVVSYEEIENCPNINGLNIMENFFFGGAVNVLKSGNNGEIAIEDCIFEGNRAGSNGGAITIYNNAEISQLGLRIIGCNFTRNKSLFVGGGVYVFHGEACKVWEMNVDRCKFEGNIGCYQAGGLAIDFYESFENFTYKQPHKYNNLGSKIFIRNSIFTENLSIKGKSAHTLLLKSKRSISSARPSIIIENCTLTNELSRDSKYYHYGYSIVIVNLVVLMQNGNKLNEKKRGGIFLYESIIIFSGKNEFIGLTEYRGAAIHASSWSKVLLTKGAQIIFDSNTASIGGGLFHNFGSFNGYAPTITYNPYCAIGYFPELRASPLTWNATIQFRDNKAEFSGAAIFVTDLKKCSWIGNYDHNREDHTDINLAFNTSNVFSYYGNSLQNENKDKMTEYGSIGSPCVKLQPVVDYRERIRNGPGYRQYLFYQALDQLNHPAFAVVELTTEREDVIPDQNLLIFSRSQYGKYLSCKDSKLTDCLSFLTNFRYRINEQAEEGIPQVIKFNLKIVESIQLDIDNEIFEESSEYTIVNPHCDAGFFLGESGKCECGSLLNEFSNGVAKCNADGALLKAGYWGIQTKSKNNTNFTLSNVVAKCPHSTCGCGARSTYGTAYCEVTDNPDELCFTDLNKRGDICGECKEGFAYIPLSVGCVLVPKTDFAYLMIIYVAITFFLAVTIMLVRVELWNGFRIFILMSYAMVHLSDSSVTAKFRFSSINGFVQSIFELNFIFFPPFKNLNLADTEMLSFYPVAVIYTVIIIFSLITASSYYFPSSKFHLKFKLKRQVASYTYLYYTAALTQVRLYLFYTGCIFVNNNGNDEYRNILSGNLKCFNFTTNYNKYSIFAMVNIIVFVLPFPIILFIASSERFSLKYPPLYSLVKPFTRSARYMWAWEFVRFIVVAITLTVYDIEDNANFIIVIVLTLLLVIHTFMWPYKENSANYIEVIGWLLLITLFLFDKEVRGEELGILQVQFLLFLSILVLLMIAFITYLYLKVISYLSEPKIKFKIRNYLIQSKRAWVCKLAIRIDHKLEKEEEEKFVSSVKVKNARGKGTKIKVSSAELASSQKRDTLMDLYNR